jgi:hypothetical protein
MILTRTHVSVYNRIEFADPYKICDQCGSWIDGVLDAPGRSINVPCEHKATYTDLCPSWSPVDGCSCIEHLGERRHPLRGVAA